jgi:hypothetical protein
MVEETLIDDLTQGHCVTGIQESIRSDSIVAYFYSTASRRSKQAPGALNRAAPDPP